MFRQDTTIVVGAGASCELGLPSGEGLKQQIMGVLGRTSENSYGFSDHTMQLIMKAFVGADPFAWNTKLEPFRLAADRILRGLPLAPSIDNFLHSHQEDENVVRLGKLAIGLCILRAERHSHFFTRQTATERVAARLSPRVVHQPTIRESSMAKTWYPALAQQLFSGVQRNNIKQVFENVRFVVFNYDRCLEQFIWMALQDYFDVDGEEAAEALEGVQFSHPYGSLGVLPWRSNSGEGLALGEEDVEDYWFVGTRLRTFTESVKSDIGRSVTEAIEQARTIIILGFGYLDQNIQLLCPGPDKRASRVLSTGFGVSLPDQDVMKNAMMTLGKQTYINSHVEPGTCRDLFDNYRLMLSLY